MKKLIYLLILPLSLLNSSCTMMVKGLSTSIASGYNNQKQRNIDQLRLTDQDGKEQTFGTLFAGKTVYLYVWKLNQLLPPDDQNIAYKNLKKRFGKYDDVVFINLYTGNSSDDWQQVLALKNKGVHAYWLTDQSANKDFKDLMGPSTSPQIIGTEGTILSFKGPKPSDKVVVDYVLYQARSGQDGTQSAKVLIKGINTKGYFKHQEMTDWYEKHFNKKAGDKMSFGISSDDGSVVR